MRGEKEEPRPRTQAQRGGIPPGRRPPGRTAIATAEHPRPSKEQIIAAIKGMSQYELRWLVNEVQKLMRGNVDRRNR
ncbi:MAG TPA: hypothetical protein VMW64_07500 [Dehalococcoidia bacterium]|nr:hypothetical protein [Dehalococcoidia bacterium]